MDKKRVLEKLFAGLAPDDGQMQMLKYCVMGQLEEALLDDLLRKLDGVYESLYPVFDMMRQGKESG